MAAPTHPVPPTDELQADVYAWTGVIARSRLPMNTKLVAFTVTTFANGNGSRVFPGISRLVVRTGFSRSTITRALAYLRDVGLLELVRRGNRRRGLADEYRLILAPDLLDRLYVRSLDDEAAEATELSREHSEGTKKRQRKQRLTVSIGSVSEGSGAVDNTPEPAEKSITLTVTAPTAETRSYGQDGPLFTVTALTPHLRIEHLPRKTTYGSSLADDLTTPSTPDVHQMPLLASVGEDEPERQPVDDYQLTLPVEIPAPAVAIDDAHRAAMWPVLGAQLARINTRPHPQGAAS